MSFKLKSPSYRIVFAIGISVLLHGLLLWVPNIELPHFKSSLPPLMAKLEALPSMPAKPIPGRNVSSATKPKHKAKPTPQFMPAEDIPPAASSVAAESSVDAASSVAVASTGDVICLIAADSSDDVKCQVVVASSVAAASSVADSSSVFAENSVTAESLAAEASTIAAASAPPATETLAQSGSDSSAVERPQLPRRAQLIFDVFKGTSDFKIGKVMHTLERDDGRYVLQSVTETVGLAKLFKTYKLTQYSSGSYTKLGLQPEHFFEERAESIGTQRNTLEFDYSSQRARFSHGGVTVLPPDTQDILSILYQFPPLAHTKTVAIFVGNSKKIERYEFEIADSEDIRTAMGQLHTVHLRKMHQPNEEGLEIWLALEYRLLPVKMRIIDRNGEISGESIINDIRAEFEEERNQYVNH